MKINITREGIVECYGNRAGFVKDKTAVIDEMFKRDEVADYLKEQHGFKVAWEKGVYDRLIKGEIQDSIMLKSCRIHQLKPGIDMRMKYISYEDLINKGYGEPDIANYRMVYDGDVGTNNLEEIYDLFNRDNLPSEYTGYALSMSDIIELYDDSGSNFYYVDSRGFIKLDMHQIEETQSKEKKIDEIKKPEMPKPKEEHEMKKQEEPTFQAEPTAQQEEFQVETFKISM